MGTLTITASGFANLPATTPAGWPAGIAYPANGNPNGTKTYTVSDADWLKVLTWAASSQFTPPASPTAPQILLAWLQIWINGTKNSVSQFFTVPAVPGAPPTIT